jgi:hypothetical protein
MSFALISEDSIVSASQVAVYRRTGQSPEWEEVLEPSDSTFQEMGFADPVFGCVAGGEIYYTKRRRPNVAKENEFMFSGCI